MEVEAPSAAQNLPRFHLGQPLHAVGLARLPEPLQKPLQEPLREDTTT
jgi:hypothetical protein